MKYLKTIAKILTFIAIFSFASCSSIYERYADSCKYHAYVNRGLHNFINSRFHYNSPVRMAIIPFSVAANLTAKDSERPGLANELAWKVHAALIETNEVPILEVFNRQDWPMKKEEFFTGNFGALDMAREAGYDLVLIGYIEPQNQIHKLDSYIKILDVESGVTVYYGKVISSTTRDKFDDVQDFMLLGDKDPAQIYLHVIEENLGACISKAVLDDDQVQ